MPVWRNGSQGRGGAVTQTDCARTSWAWALCMLSLSCASGGAQKVERGASETASVNVRDATASPVRKQVVLAEGQGQLFQLFKNPDLVGADCSVLDTSHIIWPVQMGGPTYGALLNLDRETGELLASCGSVPNVGLPHETRYNMFFNMPDGRIVARLGLGGLVVVSEDVLIDCGLDCFSYDQSGSNDTPIQDADGRGPGSGALWNYSNGTFFRGSSFEYDEDDNRIALTFTVDGENGEAMQLPRNRDVVAVNSDGRRLTYSTFSWGNPEVASSRTYVTFAVDDMDGSNLAADFAWYPFGHFVHHLVVDGGFYVAVSSASRGRTVTSEPLTQLVFVSEDGISDRLGFFPVAQEQENVISEGMGGRLMPWDACLYSGVIDTDGDQRVLLRRCIDGTYEEVVRTSTCSVYENFCLIGGG